MSYNLIYFSDFYDAIGDKIDVEIYQNDFPGVPERLLLDSNPVTISYPKKDFYDTIFGGGAKINIINPSTNFFRYDTLFSKGERDNYVKITKTSSNLPAPITIFEGYVLPQMYSSTIEKNIKITIPATDQLSMLDKFIPMLLVDASGYRADEYINAFDLISTTLVDADISNKIAINNTLENINYVKDTSSTVFNNVFLNAANFADNQGIQNDKICLDKILDAFYSRIYYDNGQWKIERIPDIADENKGFVLYEKNNDDVSYYVDANTRRNLACSDHKILSNTANLTFYPGYKRLALELKYKQPDSLVENIYWDTQYYVKDLSIESNLPFPKLKRWMLSDTEASIFYKPWADTNITSGIYFAPSSAWGINLAKWGYFTGQYATTMFEFSPDPSGTILNIAYNYSVPQNITGSGYSVNGWFALRGVDENGNNWWIAKSHPEDTSTYWSSTLYRFNASTAYDDLVQDNFKFEVNEQIDITSPVVLETKTYSKKSYEKVSVAEFHFLWWQWDKYKYKWVTRTYTEPSKTQLIGQLFLDIYPISRTYSGATGYIPYNTMFGDVDIDQRMEIPNNILEVSIGEYNDVAEFQLDIFDIDGVNYTNGLYNMDASGYYRSIGGWRDSSLDNYVKLQEKYLEDLSQMLTEARYNMTVDVKSLDSSLFTLGNIYVHDKMKYPDGSTMEFLCCGLDYNVAENSYRLFLQEFIDDEGWRVNPLETNPSGYYLNVDPESLEFTYLGASPDNTVEVNSNETYTAITTNTWLDVNIVTNTITVTADPNYGVARDGSVYVYTANNSVVIPVTQDSSAGYSAAIGWNLNGTLNVSGIPAGAVVDISLMSFADAAACSYYSNFSSNGMITYTNDGGTDIMSSVNVAPGVPDCDYAIETIYRDDIGITNASSGEAAFYGTGYYVAQDGETSSSGYITITRATIQGGGDASIVYSTWGVGADGIAYRS